MKNQRKVIPTALRKKIYLRDKMICQGCGFLVILTKNIKTKEEYMREAGLDHIRPLSQGGEDTEGNLRTMCRGCNSRKGDRDDKELKFLDLNKGHYTRIHNAVILALARIKLNTRESRIVMAIISKTYGWNTNEATISNQDVCDITGINRHHCSTTISRLLKRQIVTKNGNKVRINKYFFEWDAMLPKLVTKELTPKSVTPNTKIGNNMLPKMVTPNTKIGNTLLLKTPYKTVKDNLEIQEDQINLENILATMDDDIRNFRAAGTNDQWIKNTYLNLGVPESQIDKALGKEF